jgi:hypothetical protein
MQKPEVKKSRDTAPLKISATSDTVWRTGTIKSKHAKKPHKSRDYPFTGDYF